MRGLPARVTVLSGPSGVGKTRLADAYARQCIADSWPLVLRLSATDEISLLIGLDQVAESLGAWDAGSDVSRTVPAVLTLLRDAEAEALYQRCVAGYPRGGVAELMARGGLAALR